MTGEEFRAIAEVAIPQVAAFLDRFPDMLCVMRITGKFGSVVIGLEEDNDDQGSGNDGARAG